MIGGRKRAARYLDCQNFGERIPILDVADELALLLHSSEDEKRFLLVSVSFGVRVMTKPSIMCAIDFTDACDEALRVAVEEAKRRDAILDIVHVWFPSDMVAVDMSGISGSFADPDLPQQLREQLDSIVVDLPEQDVRRHLLQGNAADQVVAKATELGTQLLVVGTHTRGAIARWFLGSVVTELLRISPCPILVCRTPPNTTTDDAQQHHESAST